MTPIVLCLDPAYARPAGVVLSTLASSGTARDAPLEVIVLDCGLSAQDRGRLQDIGEKSGLTLKTRRITVPPDVFVSQWISPASYGRLLIPDLLPEYSSALYLDADILIVDSIAALLGEDLAGAPVGAVRDSTNPMVSCGICLDGWRALGLPADREYFNSGVILLDLRVWRERDLGGQALAFQRDFPQHVRRCWDQDALNVVVDDQWKRLDLRWNTFPIRDHLRIPGQTYVAEDIVPLERLVAAEENAAVIHFAGPGKPWEASYPRGHWQARYAAALDEFALVD